MSAPIDAVGEVSGSASWCVDKKPGNRWGLGDERLQALRLCGWFVAKQGRASMAASRLALRSRATDRFEPTIRSQCRSRLSGAEEILAITGCCFGRCVNCTRTTLVRPWPRWRWNVIDGLARVPGSAAMAERCQARGLPHREPIVPGPRDCHPVGPRPSAPRALGTR